MEDDKREALERCRLLLVREGFTVSWVVGSPTKREARSPDLIATKGVRLVRVFVLRESEVDVAETKAGVHSALQLGETRLYVPWPLRWRALSNLERWRFGGVSVGGL